MVLGFNVAYRRSCGNLHIRLQGEFNSMCAWELIKTIRQRYSGSGRVFVDTAGLTAIRDSGVALFKAHQTPQNMPRGGLYFKGLKGFIIAPDGAPVVISNPKVGRIRPRLRLRGGSTPQAATQPQGEIDAHRP
jgi:hypothetical protein